MNNLIRLRSYCTRPLLLETLIRRTITQNFKNHRIILIKVKESRPINSSSAIPQRPKKKQLIVRILIISNLSLLIENFYNF